MGIANFNAAFRVGLKLESSIAGETFQEAPRLLIGE